MRAWMLQVLIAVDQLVNALLGGWADETLSSRAWRMDVKRRPWGRILRPLIDTLLWFDPQHCRASFEGERQQRQHPPEARAHGGAP